MTPSARSAAVPQRILAEHEDGIRAEIIEDLGAEIARAEAMAKAAEGSAARRKAQRRADDVEIIQATYRGRNRLSDRL